MSVTLSKLVEKTYSGNDIAAKLGGQIKILIYKDLKNYSSIQDVLNPYGKVVILYQTKNNFGHWTCLLRDPKNNNQIDFYDAYGLIPDFELDWVNDATKKRLGENTNYLSRLLLKWMDQGGTVDYSQYELQAENKTTNTCGPHCIVRLYRNDLTPTEYYRWIMRASKKLGLNTDEFVAVFADRI